MQISYAPAKSWDVAERARKTDSVEIEEIMKLSEVLVKSFAQAPPGGLGRFCSHSISARVGEGSGSPGPRCDYLIGLLTDSERTPQRKRDAKKTPQRAIFGPFSGFIAAPHQCPRRNLFNHKLVGFTTVTQRAMGARSPAL